MVFISNDRIYQIWLSLMTGMAFNNVMRMEKKVVHNAENRFIGKNEELY